ncbi:hypothetical protein F5Y06DRAFT_62760 [Hypoxylon sp. FL0890]|nr:hypothetical protein F5Y06DRAFT_62760 [Hypoxylon sp. FL0890]
MEVVPMISNLEVLEYSQRHTQNDSQQWHDIKPLETGSNQIPLSINNGPAQKEKGWVHIAVIAVVLTTSIVGAAVGGGLGASLSTCQSNLSQYRDVTLTTQILPSTTNNSFPMATSASSTAAAFPTTTGGLLVNYTIEPFAKIYNLQVECANLSSTYQMSQDGDKYSVYCGQAFGAGNMKDGNNNDVVVRDILSVIAYSMADCLQACSQYTYWSRLAGISTSCGAVMWTSDVAHSHNTGNCFLKNSTITIGVGTEACSWCYSATKVL